jgi:hypothetical protein
MKLIPPEVGGQFDSHGPGESQEPSHGPQEQVAQQVGEQYEDDVGGQGIHGLGLGGLIGAGLEFRTPGKYAGPHVAPLQLAHVIRADPVVPDAVVDQIYASETGHNKTQRCEGKAYGTRVLDAENLPSFADGECLPGPQCKAQGEQKAEAVE